AVGLAGCSDSYGGRLAVSGNIKLEGQPLKTGSITFVPLDGQDTQSGSTIKDGYYSVPRENGLKPGNYLVMISAGDARPPAGSDEIAGPGGSRNIVSMDLVPEDWNSKSKQKVEVKASGGNKFDFNIPNANVPTKKK